MTEYAEPGAVRVVAPNGVTWTRRQGGRSTGPELLQALIELRGMYDLARQWDWWQEGRSDQEHERVLGILHEWDNGAPAVTEDEAETFAQEEMDKFDRELEADRKHRADLAARIYDEEREHLRLRLLRVEADAAFFGHVIAAPASPAQLADAERRVAECHTTAGELRDQLGDPEQVIDRSGSLPAERREFNLSSHMQFWRHPVLREWAKSERRRFNALLKMPIPEPSAMCSECQAPTEWHEYDLSLRLFQQPPPPGSREENIARLIPGWWERCPACTGYRIKHKWGGNLALPDFGYEQWRAMLPPLLRTIFTPADPKPRRQPRRQPAPLAVIGPGPIGDVMARLTEAQGQHPTAQLRHGKDGTWELWPS